MRYYTENNRPQRLWALICTAVYVVILVVLSFVVRFHVANSEYTTNEIVVDFTEQEIEKEIEQEPESEELQLEQTSKSQHHDKEAPVNKEQQVTGPDTKNQTVINEKTLFKMPKGGVDEPENTGNPNAPQGETNETRGKEDGPNSVGTAELDAGLQGRGVVGKLPLPTYKGNETATIVVSVTVNEKGEVTKAKFQSMGSSTMVNNALIEAAEAAALKARFKEGRAFAEGGTITYRFILQ